MRVLAFVVAFGVGVISAVSCTPPKKCTASNCMGCCTTKDTCETGDTSATCGKGGATCDTCISNQLCTAGRCDTVMGTGGGGAGGGGAAGGTVTGELTGSYRLIWGWDADGGRTANIANFSQAVVGFWFNDAGTPDFKRGVASADGTFVIRDVPVGEVMVQADRRYFVTSSRSLIFDTFVGGRLSAPQANMETFLNVTIRGLEPITANQNRAGMFFTANPGAVTNLENAVSPAAPPGSTTIDGEIDWADISSALDYGLPDSAQGDKGWALQFHTTTTDAGTTTSIVRAAEFNAFTLTNGGTATATADVTAPTTQPFTVAFDTAAFTALRGSFGRSAGVGRFSFVNETSPSPPPHTYIGQGAITLASASVDDTSPVPTVGLPSAFPATWGRIVSASYLVPQLRSALPDGGAPAEFSGGISFADRPENLMGTVGVRLGPVRGAQIAARNFIEDQNGVGLTPTVTWMAPTTGTVSSYRVSISRLTPSGDDVAELWRIYTPNLSVTLPPRILATGQAYVFEVEALSFGQGGISFTLPYSLSSVVSGVIRP